MSTMTETIFLASNASTSSALINNREGDWNAYLRQINDRRHGTDLAESTAEALIYKRQCALAYLGRRAQLYGGVCSKTTPRILTPKMIAELGESNRAKRYLRYPWIEKLLDLMTEIELTQDQSASSSNVFSLMQSVEGLDESPSATRLELADSSRTNLKAQAVRKVSDKK